MPKQRVKTFDAVLERKPGRLGWVIVRMPFDAAKLWGRRGQIKVKGEINGFGFRTSLFPDGQGGHALLVNKKMQRGAEVRVGGKARFRLEADTEKRPLKVPAELARVLRGSKRLREYFESFSYWMQRWMTDRVAEGKGAETRVRRAEQVAEHLMETMEAERELPPLLKLALARNPQARAGWERMTEFQRRGELLAVFYYRNVESRARRLEKAIEKMAERAERSG